MNPLSFLVVPLLVLAVSHEVRAEGPCRNAALDDITFKIARGKHKAKPHATRKLRLASEFSRQVHFQVRFHDDIKYTTDDPQNQLDSGKLMGISTYLIHKNSVRLGWSWNPDKRTIGLRFYGYLNKQRISLELAQVQPETWNDVSLTMENNRLSVTVNGNTHEEVGDMNLPTWLPIGTAILATAYYGGDEKANQTITIDVRGIAIDEPCQP